MPSTHRKEPVTPTTGFNLIPEPGPHIPNATPEDQQLARRYLSRLPDGEVLADMLGISEVPA